MLASSYCPVDSVVRSACRSQLKFLMLMVLCYIERGIKGQQYICADYLLYWGKLYNGGCYRKL